jgi:hypothetical protein
MDETMRLRQEQLEGLDTAIRGIEEGSAPLRKSLQKEWLKVEKAQNAYKALKADLMPQIRQIEGHREEGGSTLQDLISQANALLRAGARRD